MKKRCIALLLTLAMGTALLGCGSSNTEKSDTAKTTKESDKESVVVTMPTSSEPEAGFDPAYGWGAGEHVHEPLIQSTLTTTTKDLKIGKDLATDYSVSEDGEDP